MANLQQRLNTPQNVEAERAFICCAILDPNILYNFKVKPEYFYKPEHKLIWIAVHRLFIENKPLDFISLKEELRVMNKLEESGGEEFLNSLATDEFVPSNAPYYFGLIKDAYTLRNIIEIGTQCIETGYNPNIKAQAAKERVLSSFNEFQDDDETGKTFSLTDLVQREWDDLHYRIEHPDMIGTMTGFSGYDLISGGLHPQDLVIVAARPGFGKTALVLKMLLNMAKNGIPSYLWEFEMGRSQLVQRLTSIVSNVSLTKIVNGKLDQKEYDRVANGLKSLQGLPIYMETDVSANVFDIMTQTRKMVLRNGVKVMALDHVQLVPTGVENQTQEIGNISRQIKKIAMELDITCILVSQLSRAVERRDDKRPTLSDLRQSGNLEENADQVLFLYREEMYEKKDDNLGVTELIIGKHRNGPLGNLPLIFKAETANYTDLGMHN
jgi:replicative DNA helicase